MTFFPFELSSSWKVVLADELEQPYFQELAAFLEAEYRDNAPVYPPRELIFNALNHTDYKDVKVVIVGQDPYHGEGQAHGLSFSVPVGARIPPSLRNIYKEIHNDLGLAIPAHGSLLSWATQGVLLLNATLTVREGEPKSHYGRGWERFTDAVISKLGMREDPLIFVLWGRSAKDKVAHIKEVTEHSRHLILTSAHPSPLSAHNGFFGNRHFSQANTFFKGIGKPAIDWSLPAAAKIC